MDKLIELKNAIKSKVLFRTEDGVDIYVGDSISTVLLSTMEIFTANGSAGRDTRPVEGFKYFSTKEKAEEYILINKPCFSIADIYNYFKLHESKD